MIIDDEVYLIGASIKDLGKKWFGFTLMEKAEELLVRILQPSIIKGYFVDFEHNEWLLAYIPPDLAGEKQKPEAKCNTLRDNEIAGFTYIKRKDGKTG